MRRLGFKTVETRKAVVPLHSRVGMPYVAQILKKKLFGLDSQTQIVKNAENSNEVMHD